MPVAGANLDVAVNPAGTRVYVASNSNNNVAVIDTATNTVVATIPVGSNPYGVSINPAGTRLYVVNRSSNNVSVIDTATNSVVDTVAVGSSPVGFGNFIASPPAVVVDAAPVPVPTLSELAMVMLAVLLALGAWWRERKGA